MRSKNKWGWSSYSSVTSIKAASEPDQPNAPTTAISGTGVHIQWTAPNDLGESITAYLIEIKDSGGIYRTETSNCNGAVNPVLSALACTIPMTTLSSAPFSLTLGTLIEARVTAINAVGTGLASDPNTSGALIRTVPSQMSAPIKGAATTES